MTTRGLHTTFNLRYQEIDSEKRLSLLSDEVDYYLNMAQLEVVKQRAPKLGVDKFVTSDISNLLVESDYTNITVNETELELSTPSTMLFYVRAQGKLTRSGHPVLNTLEIVDFENISTYSVDNYRTTTDNKPWIFYPGIFEQNNKFKIFIDYETTLSTVKIIYIKRPVEIKLNVSPETDIQPEVRHHLHDELVNIAVQLAIQDVSSLAPNRE
jgi:hypothetical protein